MRTHLPGTDAWIEPNNLSIAGRSFALVIGSVYERIAYLYRQLFASSADGDHLEHRHAFEYGLRRKQPSAAEGEINFQATEGPFAVVPANYQITRADGVIFEFLSDAVPDSFGLYTVAIRALETGAHTNTLPQTPLDFAPNALFPQLPEQAFVGQQGIGGGADTENDEELRTRVLLRKQFPPHGGSKSDYIEWALAVPGVTRAFISPFRTTDASALASPVTLYPLFDDTRANGIPTGYDLLIVGKEVDKQRPVTARVYLAAPAAVAVDIEIAALQPDTVEIRASILSNLRAVFFERVPVVTVENQFTLPVAWVDEAISRAPGYVRHRLAAPGDDVVFAAGTLPILGAVIY
jgi:uncharacterized phage protein gp47/JayE